MNYGDQIRIISASDSNASDDRFTSVLTTFQNSNSQRVKNNFVSTRVAQIVSAANRNL